MTQTRKLKVQYCRVTETHLIDAETWQGRINKDDPLLGRPIPVSWILVKRPAVKCEREGGRGTLRYTTVGSLGHVMLERR